MSMQDFHARYEALNEAQKKAVDAIDGPVLVVAGPGSGKTELLSLRVANILKRTDLPPSSILCLTFTDAAAHNMRERLTKLIGKEAHQVDIHTFHSFGAELMGRYPKFFYGNVEGQAADELTQYGILEEILKAEPHDSPLGSYREDIGYPFLKQILKRISQLKQGALSAKDLEEIIEKSGPFLRQASALLNNFFIQIKRISKNDLPGLAQLHKALEEIPCEFPILLTHYHSIKTEILEDFKKALEAAMGQGTTKPITEWKKNTLCKNAEGNFCLKAESDLKKHKALARIYEKYQQALERQAYYDFDDMILMVLEALKKKSELRFNLQERYQYVLVDEFQDTNEAQMELLDHILDTPINEGRPNILAVGDDDQSIFKFQGAKLKNILRFHTHYRSPELIVLTENYRSTQAILDFIRETIVQGEERLENHIQGVVKDLRQANVGVKEGKIEAKVYINQEEELYGVAKAIKQRADAGEDLNQVVLLAPVHKLLEKAAHFLNEAGVAVSYERKQNVFENDLIRQLITMMRFVGALSKNKTTMGEEYLPEILSFPLWEIPRIEVWKLALTVQKAWSGEDSKTWLESMLEHENPQLRRVADFFIQLGILAQHITGEAVIDYLTGIASIELSDGSKFSSPFYAHYFSPERREENETNFLDHLLALQTLVQTVRDYQGKEGPIFTEDILKRIDLYETHHLHLNYESWSSTGKNAVKLMTPYKAKGLEFATVYLLSCTDSLWFPKKRGESLSLPKNLPLAPDDNNSDDALRVLYVALSRAKQNLHLSSFLVDGKNKPQETLRFLEASSITFEEVTESQIKVDDLQSLVIHSTPQFKLQADEKELFRKVLETYQLSPTHLNTFLDVEHGGPQIFFERNLLRFPMRPTLSLVYGNLIHKSIEWLYMSLVERSKVPALEELKSHFEKSLNQQRLAKFEYLKLLGKGQDQLSFYYKVHQEDFVPEAIVERNFKHQGVVVEGVPLTGKIDKMLVHPDKTITVYDLKTGKPFKAWEDYNAASKSWRYQQQLLFYKLLIENSRDYHGYKVTEGVIDFFEPLQERNFELRWNVPQQELEELIMLIKVVYKKIMALDFPDTSQYPKNRIGVQEFMEDLLNEKI